VTCALGAETLASGSESRRSLALHAAEGLCAAVDGRLDDADGARVDLGLDPLASDAEILSATYRRYGEDCVARLRGDFALAIWDPNARALVAARDTFGARPLYYAVSDRGFLLASDPEQLISSGWVSTSPDPDSVLDYLLWDPRSTSASFFRDIRALPPGHVMTIRGRDVRTRPFRPTALRRVELPSRDAYWEEYRHRFDVAVTRRIGSRYPVVSELSGGVDSSSIVCAADRIVATGSAACPSLVVAAGIYPGLPCNEEPFIDAVARQIRLPVQKWDATQGVVDELAASSIALPGGRVSAFSGTDGQLRIAHALHARIVLSGIGGDQIGVPWGGIRDAVTEGRWRDAARMIRDRPGATRRTQVKVLEALARSFVPSPVRRLRALLGHQDHRPQWLSEWARRHARTRPEPTTPPEAHTEIARRNWRSLTSGMHSSVLAVLQQHAIREGVEYRFPFLDIDLVSLALSIPARHWPPPWPFERLQREVFRDRLPAEIVARRSKGNFEPALELRVRRHLPTIRDLIDSGPWMSAPFVDRTGARRLLQDFLGETPALTVIYGLWAVVTLEAWMRALSRLDSQPETGRT
jgi:asparagine synthase (glutamine-hydrolysing)